METDHQMKFLFNRVGRFKQRKSNILVHCKHITYAVLHSRHMTLGGLKHSKVHGTVQDDKNLIWQGYECTIVFIPTHDSKYA